MKTRPKKPKIAPENAKLLRLINQYLVATGNGPYGWGVEAMGDGKFVGKLEAGQKIRVATRERALSALKAGWGRIAKNAPVGFFGGPWEEPRIAPG